MRPRRLLVVLSAGALLTAMVAERAQAEEATAAPVVVTLEGSGTVRVVVAEGNVLPCTSSDNRKLWDGKFEPGGTLSLSTMQGCVCVQHTIAPFADTDWAPSETRCRPMICTGRAPARICHPAPDPTIRVELRSVR
jgi:hypothetical protein